MTPEQIKQLDQDAKDYPLRRRIAALLYMEGVTYKQAFEMNLSAQVRTAYHDIEFGIVAITPRLNELARQLVGPQSVWVVIEYVEHEGDSRLGITRTLAEAVSIVESYISESGLKWEQRSDYRWTRGHMGLKLEEVRL